MIDIFVTGLRTLNDLLTAGIAITAFSLLLYAMSFNLRDRVTRSFAIILLCVVAVFVTEALVSVSQEPSQLEFWLRLQWLGIIFLPAGYLHLSDALLATTGRPSRGRRRNAVRTVYLISILFLIALPGNWLIGPLIQTNQPAPYLQRTWLTWLFAAFYVIVMVVSGINLVRAYQRTVARASRRRMRYLLIGALAPALGSYPYLLFGAGFASQHPVIFWLAVTLSNLLISALLILMAYAVAFFGVPWPDRVVKRRLLKWLMRGPVTASTVLTITTLVRRASNWLGVDVSASIPVIMVASILIMEHLITLAAPVWERWLFSSRDREDLALLQTLDERLLTVSDLRQFLEAVLAAVCDRLQTPHAFIATLGHQGLEMLVMIGGDKAPKDENLSENLLQAMAQNGKHKELFSWGDYWLVPLHHSEGDELLGLLGILNQKDTSLDSEQYEALSILSERATLALQDRYIQQQAFSSLEELTPQIDMIQRLRAAARYDGTEVMIASEIPLEQKNLPSLVKDALSHYWGGPKLTQSPLLGLRVVQQTAEERDENSTNALRAILKQAIDHVRPEGERRFTAEWILYNILDMKFMEGRKVREIAMRLAVSEADLYRKQRVAIEAVANAIVEMEQQAQNEVTSNTDTYYKPIQEISRGGFNGK
jgi:hypothetical protein